MKDVKEFVLTKDCAVIQDRIVKLVDVQYREDNTPVLRYIADENYEEIAIEVVAHKPTSKYQEYPFFSYTLIG